VRLTLRTLLAYLDDTLEPSEIKMIGQKVAESDAAQELVARIKQVTRRRRLTTPPATGPNSFDPNMVAEYLDNELSGEAVADLEKQCLESDVHLAEIAACHQILTLVLGEPALVPPTAKERMYGLVQGREAIPFRKAGGPAAAHSPAAAGTDPDADDMLLLGLPFYRRGSWLRWALPLAAVLLLAALGLALWQAAAPTGPPDNRVAANNGNKDADPGKGGTPEGNKGPVEPDDKKNAGAGAADPEKNPTKNNGTTTPSGTQDTGATQPGAGGTGNPAPPVQPVSSRIAPPSKERAEVGLYHSDPNAPPSVLASREAEGNEGWRRLTPGSRVYTSDRLVSLPGYGSEVRLDGGVRLLLRGHLPEFSTDPLQDFLLESACVLHKTPGFDADLTLSRGRVYLANTKENGGPAKVRLRFGRDAAEVWDLTLEPESEACVDLLKLYTRDINYAEGEDPLMMLFLMVMRGKAGVKVDYNNHSLEGPPGPALLSWDNKRSGVQGPTRIEKLSPAWGKAPPSNLPGGRQAAADDMLVALKELSKRMIGKKPPGLVLDETLQSDRRANRVLAIYCFCGLDDVRKLIDTLGDDDPSHALERDTAIYALRRWLSRDASQSNLLYDPVRKTGALLANQKYRSAEAQTVAQLLHDFPDEARRSPETYEVLARYLESDKVAIAELAYWQLRHLSPGVKLPPFNAAEPRDRRVNAANDVRKLIQDRKLPPQPDTGGAAGPAGPPPGKP
jgi:hypothetical protein